MLAVCVKLFSLFLALLVCITALSQTTQHTSGQTITLESIGHGFWKPHRPFGFRIYSTPDGTKADVKYLTFFSRREAREYLRTCLRPGAKIIYRQQKKASDRQVIGERIVAVVQQSGKKEFALIRGVRLNYFFIGSSSLAVAIQVEEEFIEE